jgi:hypothetical protein
MKIKNQMMYDAYMLRLRRALLSAYLDGCHESMKTETWVQNCLPNIIKRYYLEEENGL